MRITDRLNREFKIVLASASPRRKQLLELIGLEFEIWPSDKDEVITKNEPKDICTELSKQKALDVATQIKTYNETHSDLTTCTDILVIGADTIVAMEKEVFGKPKDEADAVRMLKNLSGNTHSVYTGVTLVFMNASGRVGEYTFYDETKVTFYPIDDEDIKAYVDAEDVLDKAGAYGIQSKAAAFVRSIDGDFYNVMGLPVARILAEIRNIL